MNKTVILVGCRQDDGIFGIMHGISNELEAKHITVLSRYFQCGRHVMITENCCVYFVRPDSNLDGIRADAVFGEESFKPILWMYTNPDADREPTMDLVTYICHIEHICECVMYNPGMSVKELVEGVHVMGRIGKKKLVEKFTDDCESESVRVMGRIGNAIAEGFRVGITCKLSDSDLATAIEKTVREETRKAINLEIMRFGVNKNKTTLTPEAVREVFKKATDNGVLKPKEDIYNMDVASLYPSMFEIKTPPLDRLRYDIYQDQCAMYGYILNDIKVTKEASKDMGGIRFNLPEIKNVIFNDPATIVMWADGTKTVVQSRDGDIYDPEKGLAMAISKKIMGNKRDYYHTFKHWLKKYKKPAEVQEFEFIMKPDGAFKFDPLAGLDLGRGEFTFHFDNDKEDK